MVRHHLQLIQKVDPYDIDNNDDNDNDNNDDDSDSNDDDDDNDDDNGDDDDDYASLNRLQQRSIVRGIFYRQLRKTIKIRFCIGVNNR
jgi:hypothetical protein